MTPPPRPRPNPANNAGSASQPAPAKPMPVGFWVGIGMASFLLLVLGMGVLYFAFAEEEAPPPEDLVEAEDVTKPARKRHPAPDPQKTEEFQSPQEIRRQEKLAPRKTASQKKVESDIVPVKAELASEERNVAPPESQPIANEPWDHALVSLDGVLALPERKPAFLTGKDSLEEMRTLAEIPVADPSDVELVLHSAAGSSKDIAAAGSGREGFILESPAGDDSAQIDNGKRWIVKRKTIAAFRPNDPYKDEVGRFALADGKLAFQWNLSANKRAKPSGLLYCLLEISHRGQSHHFQLSRPKPAEPLSYDVASPDRELLLRGNAEAVDDPNALRLDLQFEADGFRRGTTSGMKVGDKAVFRSSNRNLEIQFVFVCSENGKGPHLVAKTFAKRTVLATAGERPKEIEQVGSLRENITRIAILDEMQPTTLVDLERLAKRGEAIAKSLEKSRKRSHSLREAKQLQFMISREFDTFKKQALERKQKPHLDLLEDYEQMIDVATGYEDWCDTMRSQFQSIANSSKIDYSLYTMIDRKKVYFVRASQADADE